MPFSSTLKSGGVSRTLVSSIHHKSLVRRIVSESRGSGRGATTAYQALLLRNLARRHIYWNYPQPFGISDVTAEDSIDLDEAAVYVETTNRKGGKAYIGVRVREEGPYNHSEKFTITLGISGAAAGERWMEFEQKSGTTAIDTYNFVHRIIDDIGPGTPARRRCFHMDNLLAHRNPAVLWLIVASGHRFAFRAPYYAVDGSVEYVFNTIQHDLTLALGAVKNANDLRDEVFPILGNINDFVNYFHNVGIL